MNNTVSHEMMTPLRCIINLAEIEIKNADKNLQKSLKLIVTATKLLVCTVSDLLDRKLIERGLLVPYYELVDLGSVIEDTIQIMKP